MIITLSIIIVLALLLNYTRRGKKICARIKHGVLVWKYDVLYPWFERSGKNSWFIKKLETAVWFPWYGKRVVYIKSKDPSKLSTMEKDVKDAINNKDYEKAWTIIKDLPETPKTIPLKQIIETKLNVNTQ